MVDRLLIGIFRLLMAIALIGQVAAQNNEGKNAISRDSSGTIAASSAYIDAYPFFNSPSQGNGDFCLTIKGILLGTWVTYQVGVTACNGGSTPGGPIPGSVIGNNQILCGNVSGRTQIHGVTAEGVQNYRSGPFTDSGPLRPFSMRK